VFTSGSTGVPKCVLINHRSVIDLVEQFSELFDLSSEIILGNQAPLDYDGAVKEICLTVKNTSQMHIIPKVMFSFPAMLFKHLDEKKINTLNWSTSALRIIASLKALDQLKPEYIERFFFSGEVMPNKVLNYFRKHFPQATFVNLYGPTEITFNCTYFVVNRLFKDDEPLPIGQPFPTTEILVLNENDVPVVQGEVGEICVGGSSLALGYYNNPEATAKAFVQYPKKDTNSKRIYRTGDLGKYNQLGELMFVSRKDQQIKHMGYRIELGEIETAAFAVKNIEAACCVYNKSKETLVLFYQSSKAEDDTLFSALKKGLPRYMLPSRLIHYQELPTTTTGKIDRLALSKTLHN
jgi:non-ribosomal peptide synthetase component F